MKKSIVIALLMVSIAVPSWAEFPTIYCKRCDPGNSKVASDGQRILCYDCSTNDPPAEPIITCGRCDLRGGRVPGCDQCQIIYPVQ